MSQTFSLVCDATKETLWVGQGWGDMTTLYHTPAHVQKLLRFFNAHHDMPLRFVCDDRTDDFIDAGWKEFEAPESERWGNETKAELGA